MLLSSGKQTELSTFARGRTTSNLFCAKTENVESKGRIAIRKLSNLAF